MVRVSTVRLYGLSLVSAALALGGCESITGSPDNSPIAPLADVAANGSGAGNGPVRADRCDGTLDERTVENVEVVQGSTCVLAGTRVEGNVLVRSGATLEALGAHIEGNIQAEDAAAVVVSEGTRVGGDVQVKRRAITSIVDTHVDGNLQVEEWGASLDVSNAMVGGDLQVKKAEAARIDDATVRGNLQLEENRGSLHVSVSAVSGNLQVVKNRGGVSLLDNHVEQGLQCDENQPAPVGSGNRAGELEGQCTGLG